MQSTPDRDEHVAINWKSITPGMDHNFIKYSASELTGFDHKYDYDSIMHYSAYAFSEDASPTIVPRVSDSNLTLTISPDYCVNGTN